VVAVFGESNATGDPYKVDVAWNLQGPAGRARIYNSNGSACLGPRVGEVAAITGFSIRGDSDRAVQAAVAYLAQVGGGR
jgi:hypothetical protein